MSDFFFFIRVMVFTFVAVLLMQVHWGSATIETHAMRFLTESSFVAPIDDTAQAAVVVIRNGWNTVIRSFNTRFSHSLREENRPGTRLSGLSFGRSEAVEKSIREKSNQQRAEEYISEQGTRVADNSAEAFAKLKQRAREAGSKIRSRFIDETKNPVDDGRASASPAEDETIEE